MKREVLSIPGLVAVSFFHEVVKAGPFVFVAGQCGRDLETNRIVTSLDDLPRDIAKELASGDGHTDRVEGPILAQTWLAYTRIKKALEGAESSLDNILQATVYLIDMRRNFPAFNRVRKRFLKSPPPSTVLEISKLADDDALLEIAVMALIPDRE